MADIEVKRVHHLGLEEAREHAERMAEHLGRKFDLRGDWNGNVLRFERPGVSGTLAVTDKDVQLSVSLGFLLKAMKGSIEGAIRHELDELFANAAAKPASAKPATASDAKSKKAPAPRKKGG